MVVVYLLHYSASPIPLYVWFWGFRVTIRVQGLWGIGLYNIVPCLCWWSPGWRESVTRLTLSNMSQHFMLILCRQGLRGPACYARSLIYIFFWVTSCIFSSSPLRLHPTLAVQISHENPEAVYISIYSVFTFNLLHTENISMFCAT